VQQIVHPRRRHVFPHAHGTDGRAGWRRRNRRSRSRSRWRFTIPWRRLP
jgi:hypothetical protein